MPLRLIAAAAAKGLRRRTNSEPDCDFENGRKKAGPELSGPASLYSLEDQNS
jgi:hypothetical protein